jgi:hypothetical protein
LLFYEKHLNNQLASPLEIRFAYQQGQLNWSLRLSCISGVVDLFINIDLAA